MLELLRNTVTLAVGHHGRDRGARHRPGVRRRAHRPAGPPAVARAAGRTARRAGVRQRLRVGVAGPLHQRLRRGLARRDALLLPARLPPGRRGAPRPRPGARGGVLVARPHALAGLHPGGAAPAATGPARRRPARRAAPARRVRRARPAALPDLHDRDLRPVRLHLQRLRGHRDGRRSWCCSASSCCSPSCACAAHRHYARVGHGAARRVRARARCAGCAGRWWRSSAGSSSSRVGVPTYALVALAGGRHVHRVPARRAALRDGLDRRPGRRRRARHDARRGAGGLAGRAPPRPADDARRAQHVRRQRAARHRRRPRPRGREPAPRAGRSTRPRSCWSSPTRSSSCPGPSSRCAPGSSRPRWCSTTWRRASGPDRWRPPAG